MEQVGVGTDLAAHPLGYLRSGACAFDAGLPQRAWQALWPGIPLPRLLLIPLGLTAAGALSAGLFQALEAQIERRYTRQGQNDPRERAVQHARLLATFTAINIFFWFADPLQGLLGPHGAQLVRSLVLVASAIALFRSWGRDQATYRRESASESLRRQLRELPGLEAALDGRTLDSLSPQEVFTLVKAMPALGRQQGRGLYRDVMAEMLRTGRLERARALLELQELRQTLQLEEADHHAVVRMLAQEQPELLERNGLQRQVDDLRREAAREAVSELLRLAGQDVLDSSTWPADLRERLERLRLDSGLEEKVWQAILEHYGPHGELERQRLTRLQAAWLEEAALAALLAHASEGDPLLRPLRQASALRLKESRSSLQPRLQAAGMEPLPTAVPAAGGLEQVFDLLWRDADPDTAAWVLMLERQRTPGRVPARLQDPRPGLGDSPFLQDQREGRPCLQPDELEALASCGLFADLLPSGLVWVARQGALRRFAAGEVVMTIGDPSDSLDLVVSGDVQLQTSRGRSLVLGTGEAVGKVGLITGMPRMATVVAGPEGATLFVLPAEVFEEMLQRSWSFARGLLGQLAQRLVAAGTPQP